MAGKRVFVTGGTGFLGRHLVRTLLAYGYDLCLLVRPTSDIEWLGGRPVDFCFGNVIDEDIVGKNMQGCDYVIHAGGLFRFWDRAGEFERINVGGTKILAQTALDTGVKKFVYISTIAVIGAPRPGELISEETTPTPQDAYQQSKLTAENIVQGYVASYGLPAVILRPGAFYGPGSRYGFNRLFIEEPLRGWKVRVDKGERFTFPVFVPDVAEAVVQALQGGGVGEVYNIADQSLTHNELNALVSRLAGISERRLDVPSKVMIGLAGLMEGVARVTSREPFYPLNLRHYVFKDWQVDHSKAARELSFQPTPIEVGLQVTIDWLRQEIKSK